MFANCPELTAVGIESFNFSELLPFIGVGFAAQLVDGALGMAFGVISNTLMVGVLGMPPALASQRVHIVECFTTATSGISHLLHGNIDNRLFIRLLIPGMIGGILGAYLLASVDASVIKPFVLIYLAGIGVYLLVRGLLYPPKLKEANVIAPLGLAGGFLDAAGGGGWGDPRERDPELVRDDIRNGFISATEAESVYGVTLDREGSDD